MLKCHKNLFCSDDLSIVPSEDVQSNKGGGLPKIKILRPLILNPFLPVLLKLDETVDPKTRKTFLR